jgi:hypothetical protein
MYELWAFQIRSMDYRYEGFRGNALLSESVSINKDKKDIYLPIAHLYIDGWKSNEGGYHPHRRCVIYRVGKKSTDF